MITPIKAELSLRQFELKITRLLAEKTNLIVVFFVAAIGASLLWRHPEFFDKIRISAGNGGGRILRLVRISLPLFLLASPMALIFEKHKKILLLSITSIVWLMDSAVFFKSLHGANFVFLLLYLPFFLMAGFTFVRTRRLDRWLEIAFIALAVAITIFFLHRIFQDNHRKFWTFWSFRPMGILVQIILVRFFYKTKSGAENSLFAPIFAVHALILPKSTKLETEKARIFFLWWQGLLNIVVGLIVAILRLLVDGMIKSTSEVWARYLMHYLLAILGIISFLNVLSGLLRIYGYSVPDATNFVFLSRSPREYWRRGSVYSYIFVRDYVYFPLLSWIKSPLLSRLGAFFIFIVVKIGTITFFSLVFSWFNIRFFPRGNHHLAYYLLIHWALWFISMEVTHPWFHRTAINETAKQGWTAIFMTHVVMASLYPATHYIYILFKYFFFK